MAEYATLARVDDVPAGALYEAEFEGRSLLIVNLGGTFHVIDALCTHLEGPLSQGELIEGQLTCPWHNGAFDVASGEPTKKPPRTALGTYEVSVADGEIRIVRP